MIMKRNEFFEMFLKINQILHIINFCLKVNIFIYGNNSLIILIILFF